MKLAALFLVLALAAAALAMIYLALRQWWEVDRFIEAGIRWGYQSDSYIALAL